MTRGELPGRKVGRKWITTRTAVLRWLQSSAEEQALTRAIGRGDGQALQEALNTGKAQIGKRK
jgi:hypothetical protein